MAAGPTRGGGRGVPSTHGHAQEEATNCLSALGSSRERMDDERG